MANEFYESIYKGLEEAVAYTKGTQNKGKATKVAILDVKAIRQKFDMTQVEFAEVIGSPVRTVQAWEQEKDQRFPTGPAQKLLLLLQKRPDFLQEIKAL